MYARVSKVMAQFVLKIEKLSHIMVPTPILEMARAYDLRSRLWLLLIGNFSNDDAELRPRTTSCKKVNLYFIFECRNCVNLFSMPIGLRTRAQAKYVSRGKCSILKKDTKNKLFQFAFSK